MKTFEYSLHELDKAASFLLKKIGEAKILAFYGSMGAGKTTLIKAICQQLNSTDLVNSPSFAIIYEYRTKDGKRLCHFDFYRIKSIDEAFALGYEDYFYSGNYCFIEWPEKIEELLPGDTCRIKIEEIKGGLRRLTVA